MEGRGAYNRSSRVQAAGLLPALSLFEQAAKAVPLAEAPEPIVIADYGASEGHNSLIPIGLAISSLRERVGPERAISVVHTDLPTSDFNVLFHTLDSDPGSYLRLHPAAFASAIGRSFYNQIFPAGSVTLGWSSWAVQWLSRIPGPIPEQVQVAYSEDPAARAAYKSQAADDWKTFLLQRGTELRPGGRLVVVTMALDETGDFGYRPVVAAMYGALLGLVEEGFLGMDEVRRMAIPTVGRSRADLEAPFLANGRFAGLAIEFLEVFISEDRVWMQFEDDHDARGYAAQWTAFCRASVFPTLALALDGGLEGSRATEFFSKLEQAMVARLSATPQRVVIPLARVVLAKVAPASQPAPDGLRVG